MSMTPNERDSYWELYAELVDAVWDGRDHPASDQTGLISEAIWTLGDFGVSTTLLDDIVQQICLKLAERTIETQPTA